MDDNGKDKLIGCTRVDLNLETKNVTEFSVHLAPMEDAEAEKEKKEEDKKPKGGLSFSDSFGEQDEGKEGPWEVVYNWKVFPRLNKLSEVGKQTTKNKKEKAKLNFIFLLDSAKGSGQ